MDDVAACTNVLFEIAEAMDGWHTDRLVELFAEAALVDGESGTVFATGGDAALAHFAAVVKVHGDGTWRTKHVTTNPIVSIDGDTAMVRSIFTVFQQTDLIALQPIIAGRYHDTFRRTGEGWCLVERRYFADLVGDLSDHLSADVRFEGPTGGDDPPRRH